LIGIFSIGYFGVGVLGSGYERIKWRLFGEFGSGWGEDIHDSGSYFSLIPYSSSWVGDSKVTIWHGIGTGFGIGYIETFGYIGKVRYSGAISGRARVTRETRKCYSSENNEDGDDDDEFDEGESEIEISSHPIDHHDHQREEVSWY
jgi:opacity protein-like surface antigen